ncbi:MAG: hypothetical protein WA891_07575, partial [Acidobacteriaceae bacterium]
ISQRPDFLAGKPAHLVSRGQLFPILLFGLRIARLQQLAQSGEIQIYHLRSTSHLRSSQDYSTEQVPNRVEIRSHGAPM